MVVGIAGYGAYIPRLRIRADEIARIWGGDSELSKRMKGEKSVPNLDEDTVTMAVEASRYALARAGISPEKISAVYVGSESHPYVVKSTSAIVAEAIEATPVMTAADLEFACKAGTAGFQAIMGQIQGQMMDYGLGIGADTAQGRPGDDLEYTAAAGAAAYIFGRKNLIAEIEGTYSFTTDTPDFWRREGEQFPRHAGRFTGDPSYFRHVISATQGLMDKLGTKVQDYDYFVFHQPNAKFPLQAAGTLGIPKEKMAAGTLFPYIGNTYSAAVPLGLAAILDIAKPGERIFATSYGSGAGSDAFSITVKDLIEEKRSKAPSVKEIIGDKVYLDYAEYAKFRRKLKGMGE
ncbi:MAG TPA: hydroxymethylglutaryl-CoA synthase [archaeon]|nr:hydroxymethylglutaryl-CoA synthase [archaeon]